MRYRASEGDRKGSIMSTRKRLWGTIALFLAFAFLWSSLPAQSEDNTNIQSLVDSNSNFALDLYVQLRETRGNLFFSPYSISTALAMTYAGARANTAKQISEVLHFTLEQNQLHRTFGHIEAELNSLREKEKIVLSVANALWAQKDYHFLEEFFELITRNYLAKLSHADFKTAYESAPNEITCLCRTTKRSCCG